MGQDACNRDSKTQKTQRFEGTHLSRYLLLEPVSKPSKDDHEASELGKAVIEDRVELVTRHKSAKVLQPTDRAFDSPPPPVTTQLAAVLSGRPYTPPTMGTDQLDAALGQPLSQRIAIGGAVVDQPLGHVRSDGLIDQRLNQIDLCGAGGCGEIKGK